MMDNWEKVESIFHTALGLPSAERNPFLQRECSGDEKLRSEVESLITSFEKNSGFLDEPVFELGLGALGHKTETNYAGTTIGFYEIEEKIGTGGMGEVYKALDTQLNRRVALKFLSESLENDNSARRQLVKEAQAAAALEHPNICAVHGIEQTDEHHFIVMQYVEGITLSEKIAGEETVSADEFKKLARQILSAAALAHSHGIIHRDLKPGNIMLTNEGQIKVLDFGLAKFVAPKQFVGRKNNPDSSIFSKKGLIIGTISYMSPEQLRGEKLDFTSDIFSIGIIFYELLTRRNPFHRASQAETIAALLNENPTPLRVSLPDFPENLLALVEKCLQKNKSDRFQSAAEILVALDNAESENSRQTKSVFNSKFVLRAALVLAVLLGIIGFVFFYKTNPPKRTLAVLPFSFEKPQAEEEYLPDGLTQSLIEKLSNLSDIKITNKFAVAGFKGKSNAPETAGKLLDVDAVFAGSIVKRNNSLFLETKLVRTSDGFVIDSTEFAVDTANLIDLQEKIAARIIEKIKSNLTDDDRTRLAKRDTENEEAKRLYYLGRYFLNRRSGDDMKNAVMSFKSAKELDPYYAQAWAGLADAYLMQSLPGVEDSIPPKEAADLARAAAKQALQIDSNLSESYNSLGLISSRFDWNWREAEANFRNAINRNPEFIPAHTNLINVLNALGRFDESLKVAQKIKELDPISTSGDLELAKIYYRKRDFPQMEKIISEVLSKNPPNDRISYIQCYLFLNTGRFNEAIAVLEKINNAGKPVDKILTAAPLGFAYAKAGRRKEALAIINNLEQSADKNYISPQERALVYVGLGNYDKAFEYLNQSCDEKSPTLPLWITDPVVDEIKTDSRFAVIKKCVNL